jgi:hypothetical protein
MGRANLKKSLYFSDAVFTSSASTRLSHRLLVKIPNAAGKFGVVCCPNPDNALQM